MEVQEEQERPTDPWVVLLDNGLFGLTERAYILARNKFLHTRNLRKDVWKCTERGRLDAR